MQQPQPELALSHPLPRPVPRLERMLGDHGAFPTAELKALFAVAAGDLGTKDLPPARLIGTEHLLMAMILRGERLSGVDAEEQALIALSGDVRRKPAAVEEIASRVRTAQRKAMGDEPDFSPSIEACLVDAFHLARARVSTEEVAVGVTELLHVFPPDGSVAADFLDRHRIPRPALGENRPGEIPPEPAAPAPPNERVSTHADEPADIDELGRRAFADILAERIREARESSIGPDPSAFIVHLHGPWGSGKTTVLNFLEANLCAPPESWIVVKFNAWRDQRLQPPWWTLIATIYAGAAAKLAPWPRLLLRLRWMRWRLRADYLPAILVAFGAILMLLLWQNLPPGTEKKGVFGMLLTFATPVVTLLGALWMGSRTLAFGSRRAAQTYAELKDDPYKPIARLFNRLVRKIGRPVVVFIDDLDRCDSKYVVELLEGIQTLMRGAPVTYVVAADRKWICSSFEQRYAGFSPPIGECGRPLGYLFLDKVFQISAAIPQIPADIQSTYWARLLSPTTTGVAATAAERQRRETEAEREVASLSRQEDLQAKVREAEESGDALQIQAMRAATAKRITSPEAALHTEHCLQAFAPLLEPNPRSMKRLVNAYAMHQATLLLAGRPVTSGPLARWTILEMRWPLLADFLALRPDCLADLARPLGEHELLVVPIDLRPLFGDELIAEVIGVEGDGGRLDLPTLKTILGAVQGDR